MSADRWYARLLWAYPKAYREERGAELLETVLASAPRRGEAASLLVGGLRVRAGLVGRRPVRESWMSALVGAALMLLFLDLIHKALGIVGDLRGDSPSVMAGVPLWTLEFPAVALSVGALLALLRGRVRLGIVLAVLMFALDMAAEVLMQLEFQHHWWGLLRGLYQGVPLAIALLIAPARRRPPTAVGSLGYLLGVSLLIYGVTFVVSRSPVRGVWFEVAEAAAVCLCGVVWAAVDGRVTLALGLFLLAALLQQPDLVLYADWGLAERLASVALAVAAPAAMLSIGARRARDQARV